MVVIKNIQNEDGMMEFAEKIGSFLSGGEVIELIGDVGAGKTTFVRGLAKGIGISDKIQSPSFTINRTYQADNNLTLSHYDFYRLESAGIMQNELAEDLLDDKKVVVIEWGDIISDTLPNDHLQIKIVPKNDNERELEITANGEKSKKLLGNIS